MSSNQASPQNSRLTIGLLTDWLETGYQASLYAGLADVAQERDVNLISFVVGALGESKSFISQRNVIGELLGPENVDGLIILSGALGNLIPIAEFSSFLKSYQPLPMVSIAVALDGIPSVVIDNEKGLADALAHLIEEHGFSRIVFIRGPEVNQEAEFRYNVYCKSLQQHQLTFDPALVLPGYFDIKSGAKAIQILLDTIFLRK